MAWISDLTTAAHGGFAIALQRDTAHGNTRDGYFRPLAYPGDARSTLAVHAVQAGCECGWRSPRIEVTRERGASWEPFSPVLPDDLHDELRAIWSEHVRGVVAPAHPPPGGLPVKLSFAEFVARLQQVDLTRLRLRRTRSGAWQATGRRRGVVIQVTGPLDIVLRDLAAISGDA